MAVIEIAKIQVRRGLEGTTGVPQLDPGEFGWAQDTEHLYIGKRIAEGANTNDNSRILTSNDLNNLFTLNFTGFTATLANSSYRYRELTPDDPHHVGWPTLKTTATTVATKLDSLEVSLSDFVHTGKLYTLTDITSVLNLAVNELFYKGYKATLKIPAGTYNLTGNVNLPPNTRIVGDGVGVTNLVYTGTNALTASMFRTVDSSLRTFDNGQSTVDAGDISQNVYIADMTLSYAVGNVTNNALISLDNSKNPVIKNVQFKSLDVTYPALIGSGISIRSQFPETSPGLGETNASAIGAHIDGCSFENLSIGISTTGTVKRTVVENSNFKYLKKGIYIAGATSTSVPPKNTLVTQNKFTNIYNEAIYVSTNTNSTNVISSENTYFDVGGATRTDNAASAANTATSGAVLVFNAPGNISSNDKFNRRDVAVKDGTFYYNPLANANVRINNAATQNKTLISSQVDQTVTLIPLTGQDQMGIIEYQLANADMSRKGRLIVNISPDGYASVSDYYNYSEVVQDASTLLVFSTNLDNGGYTGTNYLNYITVTCSNFSGNSTKIEFNIDLTV